jgi:hypothetical protein
MISVETCPRCAAPHLLGDEQRDDAPSQRYIQFIISHAAMPVNVLQRTCLVTSSVIVPSTYAHTTTLIPTARHCKRAEAAQRSKAATHSSSLSHTNTSMQHYQQQQVSTMHKQHLMRSFTSQLHSNYPATMPTTKPNSIAICGVTLPGSLTIQDGVQEPRPLAQLMASAHARKPTCS